MSVAFLMARRCAWSPSFHCFIEFVAQLTNKLIGRLIGSSDKEQMSGQATWVREEKVTTGLNRETEALGERKPLMGISLSKYSLHFTRISSDFQRYEPDC